MATPTEVCACTNFQDPSSRRATAVKDYLVSLGVGANRITVVSKGKEQPVCSEESEGCWQQNRRGHFIITAK